MDLLGDLGAVDQLTSGEFSSSLSRYHQTSAHLFLLYMLLACLLAVLSTLYSPQLVLKM